MPNIHLVGALNSARISMVTKHEKKSSENSLLPVEVQAEGEHSCFANDPRLS